MSDIRRIDPGQLRDVAAVHIAAFPESALSRFGVETVRRYYQTQIDSNEAWVFIGAWDADRLLGFACGGRLGDVYRPFFARHWAFLLGQLVRRPMVIANRRVLTSMASAIRWLVTFVRSLRERKPADAGPPPFTLLSIAVSPDAQSRGVGAQLLDEFERVAERDGFEQLQLFVRHDNANAIRFYTRRGWAPVPAGEPWHGEMRKTLDGAP